MLKWRSVCLRSVHLNGVCLRSVRFSRYPAPPNNTIYFVKNPHVSRTSSQKNPPWFFYLGRTPSTFVNWQETPGFTKHEPSREKTLKNALADHENPGERSLVPKYFLVKAQKRFLAPHIKEKITKYYFGKHT